MLENISNGGGELQKFTVVFLSHWITCRCQVVLLWILGGISFHEADYCHLNVNQLSIAVEVNSGECYCQNSYNCKKPFCFSLVALILLGEYFWASHLDLADNYRTWKNCSPLWELTWCDFFLRFTTWIFVKIYASPPLLYPFFAKSLSRLLMHKLTCYLSMQWCNATYLKPMFWETSSNS